MNGREQMLRVGLGSPSFAAPAAQRPPMMKPPHFLGPPAQRPGGVRFLGPPQQQFPGQLQPMPFGQQQPGQWPMSLAQALAMLQPQGY